jgi:hypothetical protein
VPVIWVSRTLQYATGAGVHRSPGLRTRLSNFASGALGSARALAESPEGFVFDPPWKLDGRSLATVSTSPPRMPLARRVGLLRAASAP